MAAGAGVEGGELVGAGCAATSAATPGCSDLRSPSTAASATGGRGRRRRARRGDVRVITLDIELATSVTAAW